MRRQTASKSKSATRKQKPARILVVEARYYTEIADALLGGARRALDAAGADYDVVTVPGALEIPAAVAIVMADAEKKRKAYDGAVALGCVIRGETLHFEIVSTQSARGLMNLGFQKGMAIGNGILTVDTEAQAHARAGKGDDNKGAEAARAALVLVDLKRNGVRAR
ncbi:MAG: 6,7-dimethyl-8-ribityllumazine synthase [Xanthobacteraceae bacterium]|uniref:6,7-dimethyl-8-ribityllumazine synthase n=1 Tax=Pseudolabrys sp. TaxID=1960880 RepID=UPI003D147026